MTAQTVSVRGNRTDWSVLLILIAMLVVGLIMVYSASIGYGLEGDRVSDAGYFARRQAQWIGLGVVGLLIGWRIDYRFYRKQVRLILLLTAIILIAMSFVGRWVFQRENQSIQPLELAKIGAMVYIAAWLEQTGDRIRNVTLGLIPFGLMLGIFMGLIILQGDLSSAVLLAAMSAAMLFVAGADLKQMLLLFLVGGIALALVPLVFGYNKERLDLFVKGPFADAQNLGYQPIRNLVAISEGKFWGKGLGRGTEKFILPLPQSDDIFSVIVEELGFVGALCVMLVYGLWCWRGYRIAHFANDTYGMFLATGIVSWVAFQALLNIGVAVNIVPVTGTVLPFISYGGSSIVTGMAMVGILLNISRSGGLPQKGAQR